MDEIPNMLDNSDTDGMNLIMDHGSNQPDTPNITYNITECQSQNSTSVDSIVLAREYPLDHAIVLFGYFMPILVILSIITNLSVVIVLTRSHMKSTTNIVLCTLAIVDLLTILAGAPLYFYVYTLGNYKFEMDEILCTIYHTLTDTLPVTLHNASIWLTLLLATQRFVYIRFPPLAAKWCTQDRTKVCVAAILGAAFTSQAPRFFDIRFRLKRYGNKGVPNVYECLKCEEEMQPWVYWVGIDFYFATYFAFRILFVYLVPCIALITLNCLLYYALKDAEEGHEKVTNKKNQGQNKTNSGQNPTSDSKESKPEEANLGPVKSRDSADSKQRANKTGPKLEPDKENEPEQNVMRQRVNQVEATAWYNTGSGQTGVVLVRLNGMESEDELDCRSKDQISSTFETEETCLFGLECEFTSDANNVYCKYNTNNNNNNNNDININNNNDNNKSGTLSLTCNNPDKPLNITTPNDENKKIEIQFENEHEDEDVKISGNEQVQLLITELVEQNDKIDPELANGMSVPSNQPIVNPNGQGLESETNVGQRPYFPVRPYVKGMRSQEVLDQIRRNAQKERMKRDRFGDRRDSDPLMRRGSSRRASNRTTLMLIVVVTVFLAVEVPSATVTTLHVTSTAFGIWGDDERLKSLISYTKLYSNFLIMISYSLNFYIYCSMSFAFRQTFRSMFILDKEERRRFKRACQRYNH